MKKSKEIQLFTLCELNSELQKNGLCVINQPLTIQTESGPTPVTRLIFFERDDNCITARIGSDNNDKIMVIDPLKTRVFYPIKSTFQTTPPSHQILEKKS